jgi:anti-sigma factor RsiW
MTCQELIDFLMDYCDGALPPEQLAEFEKHLHCCPPCVDYMKTYQQAVCMGKSVCSEEERAAHEVPEQLVRAILAARNVSK